MNSPGNRAASVCEINDIFLVESKCRVARDFNQTELMPRVTFQHRLLPDKEGLAQVRKDAGSGDDINIIRYFIDGGLRVLRPNVVPEDSQDLKMEDVLAEITVKIAVDYTCPKDLLEDTEAIGAFSANAVFHAWAYWRSIIHSFSDEMRLPRVTLPMMKQKVHLAPNVPSATDT